MENKKRYAGLPLVLLMLVTLLMSGLTATAEETPWGFAAMGLNLMKAAAENGDERLNRPVLVAVLDSGCDVNHAAFAGRISPDSRSFMENDTGIADEGGHGTQVAGIIADATPASVQLLILKVRSGSENASDAQYNAAILYALEKGADVINMSIEISSSAPVTQDFREWSGAIKKCYEAGIPFIVGAGNEKRDVKYMYPAADACAVAVSAVRQDGSRAPFSNFGSAIRFCGPGTDIPVAVPGTKDGYALADGTSLAAPHITAAAAYVKMLHPGATVSQVCGALTSCAMDLGEAGRDDMFGEGLPQISDYALLKAPETSFPQQPAVILLSATPGFSGEGADNLFCGDDTAKWCCYIKDGAFVEWEQTTPLAPGRIIFVTANDNEQQPGRNPEGAMLYARADSADEWTLIWRQPDYFRLPDTNYSAFAFPMEGVERAYRYFRLEIPRTTGSDVIQLSRIELLSLL